MDDVKQNPAFEKYVGQTLSPAEIAKIAMGKKAAKPEADAKGDNAPAGDGTKGDAKAPAAAK